MHVWKRERERERERERDRERERERERADHLYLKRRESSDNVFLESSGNTG